MVVGIESIALTASVVVVSCDVTTFGQWACPGLSDLCPRMPTDFVEMIYKSVDLSADDTVAATARACVQDDLGIACL